MSGFQAKVLGAALLLTGLGKVAAEHNSLTDGSTNRYAPKNGANTDGFTNSYVPQNGYVCNVTNEDAGADCGHGCWNHENSHCVCNPNWRVAGPTDTFSFLQGLCVQSQCENDDRCMKDLGREGDGRSGVLRQGDVATCPVQGWNCWCGWRYAWMESGTGASSDKAKCMGVLYALSISGGVDIMYYMEYAWRIFFAVAFLCLPLGQTHVRCQHHSPDMCKMVWKCTAIFFKQDRIKGARAASGVCDGTCTQHPISDCFYFFAWSMYVLDMMLWSYAFLAIMYLIFLMTWAVLMWLIVAVIIIVACVAACLAAAAQACGDGADGDCCCDAAPGGGTCDGCCVCPCDGTTNTDMIILYNSDFYTSGPNSDGNCCDCDCSCRGVAIFLRPAGWVISKFPRPPPNMWGGCLGRLMGTCEGGTYAGGNAMIDQLSFRRSTDLHQDNDWRNRVAYFIYSLSEEEASGHNDQARYLQELPELPQRIGEASQRIQQAQQNTTAGPQNLATPLLATERPTRLHNRMMLVPINVPFDKARDNVVESCFEDYEKNECWICTSCNYNRTDLPPDRQWHLWLTCGHMFCHQCSSEMVRRRMPCPLCRRVTDRIKEGPCYSESAPQNVVPNVVIPPSSAPPPAAPSTNLNRPESRVSSAGGERAFQGGGHHGIPADDEDYEAQIQRAIQMSAQEEEDRARRAQREPSTGFASVGLPGPTTLDELA